ncbi:MAG: hypothetical protein BGO49_03255 [Planctomycetales bacterium 71-10]|nr:MAG: hypothetical protein BGO49_03255 [Planctomycetales bacterium 71-10]
MIRYGFLATIFLVAAATRGGAQTAAGSSAVDDALFAAAAADSGAAELALSRLGLERASDPELKTFSSRMIEDHTALSKELASTAAAKQIALPSAVGPCPRFTLQSLSGLSGEHFDKCYAEAQLAAHKEAVAAFTAESERGTDPDMKALAAKALPKLKEHLSMIKPIAMRYEKAEGPDSR